MMAPVLRVMTWNVWWRFGPWEARQRAIAAVIRGQAPDVLGLQEVWSERGHSHAEALAAELGYEFALSDHALERDGRIGFHNAILSRWPLTDIRSHPLPGADGHAGHRRALIATISSPWGPWPIVSTHLAYKFDESAVRQAQVETVMRLVAAERGSPQEDLPPIVCGDLNAVPDSDEIRTLTGRRPGPPGLVFSDAWEHVGGADGATWREDNPYQAGTTWPNRRLDYVLVAWPRPKPIGNPVRAWLAGLDPVDGTVPSDHAAVVADLVTPSDAVLH